MLSLLPTYYKALAMVPTHVTMAVPCEGEILVGGSDDAAVNHISKQVIDFGRFDLFPAPGVLV